MNTNGNNGSSFDLHCGQWINSPVVNFKKNLVEEDESASIDTLIYASSGQQFVLDLLGATSNSKGMPPFMLDWQEQNPFSDAFDQGITQFLRPTCYEFAQAFLLEFRDGNADVLDISQSKYCLKVKTPLGNKGVILLGKGIEDGKEVLRVVVEVLSDFALSESNFRILDGVCNWILKKLQHLAFEVLGFWDDNNSAQYANHLIANYGKRLPTAFSDINKLKDPHIFGPDAYGHLFPGSFENGARRLGYSLLADQSSAKETYTIGIGWDIPVNKEALLAWHLYGHRAVLAILDISNIPEVRAELLAR